MTDLRKAAEMALKFCEDIGDLSGPYQYVNETGLVSDSRKVLQALRQALAQPEQEPVAWITRRTGNGGVYVDGYETCEPTDYGAIPVYTAPPKRGWAGLTDEDLVDCESEEDVQFVDVDQLWSSSADAEAIDFVITKLRGALAKAKEHK